MSLWQSLKNLIRKPLETRKPSETAPVPETPKIPAPAAAKTQAPDEEKGLMSFFYRKWKDPFFLKQMRVLAAHMAKEGIDVKDKSQVQAWIEKNKTAIEAGKFKEAPSAEVKQETYVKTGPEIGRNDPCPCGSGKKYKKCCGPGGPRS